MRRLVPTLACLLAAGSLVTPSCAIVGPVSCGFSGSVSHRVDRGVVVLGYSANNVRSVEFAYGAKTAGIYRITLEMRRRSFDGPLVGSPQTATIQLPMDLADHFVTFDFGGAPVTPGDNLTFIHHVTGPGLIGFDAGTGACSSGTAYETNGTTPPLDTKSGTGMGIGILADEVTTSCVPSDTVMCIDDAARDRRFEITLSFATVQGGGISGHGQEIVEAPLGVTHGGLFWFFSQDNPEVLIKVLNGCALNSNFWVFFSAGTNVGFSLTVKDTATGHVKTYTNADLHAATPVQDTSALSCP